MPTMDYTQLTTEPRGDGPLEPIGPIDKRRVFDPLTLEPGDDYEIDIGGVRSSHEPRTVIVPKPCTSWIEAAYHVHRLTPGRRKALKWIVRHASRPSLHSPIDVAYRLGVGKVRRNAGENAAIINGLKGLACDGLLVLVHNDGARGPCSSHVVGLSERAYQYALADMAFQRPIGRVDPHAPVERLVATLTPRAVEVLNMLGRALRGYYDAPHECTVLIPTPSRQFASAYTALERRGFVRWLDRAPAPWGSGMGQRARVPKESRFIEVLAAASAEGAGMLLTE